jgi:hypothetical protein
MKKILLLASLMLAIPASANDSSRNQLRASLVGYNEVPSVSSVARGQFVANVNPDGVSFNYQLTFSGLQAPVTQSHIHFSQMHVNGAIVVWLCGTATNPGPAGTQTCPQSGTITGLVTAANVQGAPATQQLAAGEIVEVINAMRAGAAYANIHTAVSPGGEVRGQISRGGEDHRDD